MDVGRFLKVGCVIEISSFLIFFSSFWKFLSPTKTFINSSGIVLHSISIKETLKESESSNESGIKVRYLI